MDENKFSDLFMTHQFLNILYAGYQGKFVELNILAKLGNDQPEVLEQTKTNIDSLGGWSKRMWRQDPVLTRKDLFASKEAQKVLRLFNELKAELDSLTSQLLEHQRKNDKVKIFAGMGRDAYAKEHFVKGNIAFYTHFPQPQKLQQWQKALPYWNKQLTRVNFFLEKFSDSSGQSNYYDDLYQENLLLPYVFQSYIQDMLRLYGQYTQGFCYQSAGISSTAATLWQNLGINPDTACYWYAYGISPEEAKEWYGFGITEPEAVAAWKYRGFKANEAKEWIASGVEARVAQEKQQKSSDIPIPIDLPLTAVLLGLESYYRQKRVAK